MLIHGNYYSNVLDRYKSYTAVFPQVFQHVKKVIVLLNGKGSDETSWAANVPLEDFSDRYQVAFFCPAGENSYYTNHADGENYADAFGDEFIQTMRQLYSIPQEKESTEIAGFSMGGYGAMLLGLRFAKHYSRIGAFSPAFVFYKKSRNTAFYKRSFSKGDYDSENDCVFLYKQAFDLGQDIAPIDFACGKDDPLFEQTNIVMQKVQSIDPNAKLSMLVQNGYHDFTLWRAALENYLSHIKN